MTTHEVHSRLHSNSSNRKRQVDTKFTHTDSRICLTKCRGVGLRACMSDQQKSINEQKGKQIKRPSEERVVDSWRSVGESAKERTEAEESRQWTRWAPLQVRKDESSPWHHPRSLTRTHAQMRSVGSRHEWPVYPGPWCAFNKWQPAYWSNKNIGLKKGRKPKKKNITKQKQKQKNIYIYIRSQQCINQVAVIKVDLPAFFGMLTDRQMLPESHGKQNETKITKWQYLHHRNSFLASKKKSVKTTSPC